MLDRGLVGIGIQAFDYKNNLNSRERALFDFGHERCKPAMIACSPGDTGNDMTLLVLKALRDSDPFFVPEALDPYLASGSVVRDHR